MKNHSLLHIVLCLFVFFTSCKNDTNSKEKTTNSSIKEFNYTPKPPVDGNLYGVVELGAAGFNSFIVEVDQELNWKLHHKEFGTSLLVEGMTNAMLINQKLKEYIEGIKAYDLTDEHIYFMVSSGAMKEDITKVIVQELENLGHKCHIVSPEQEGLYTLKAILPAAFEQNSYVIDIGSGNTKIAYMDKDGKKVSYETEGAKYYQKGVEDEEVYNKVKEIAVKVPTERREYCFAVGGVPYVLAKSNRVNKECYTILSPNVSDYDQLAEAEGKKIKSGLKIYKAITDTTDTKNIIFVWNGNFTIGYLLNKIALKH